MIIASIITALATLILAWFTYQNVRITRRLIEGQIDPNIIVSIEQLREGLFYGIVVRNIGNNPAYDVEIQLSPQGRTVESFGYYEEVKQFLEQKRSILLQKQSYSKHIQNNDVWAEWNNNSELVAEVSWAKKYGDPRRIRRIYNVSPTFVLGELLNRDLAQG